MAGSFSPSMSNLSLHPLLFTITLFLGKNILASSMPLKNAMLDMLFKMFMLVLLSMANTVLLGSTVPLESLGDREYSIHTAHWFFNSSRSSCHLNSSFSLLLFFPFAYCRFSVIDLREQIYCITWASCSIIKKSIPLELQAYPSNNNASALVIPLSYSAI